MDKLIFTAVSGAEHTLRAQQVHANNLANMDTPGFRANLELVTTQSLGANGNYGYDDVHMARTQADAISTKPGSVRETGRPLDVAINGNGYFAVEFGGNEAYTRAGAIDIDANGALSVSGRPLLGEGGADRAAAALRGRSRHRRYGLGDGRRRDHDAGDRQAAPGECRRPRADQERGRPDRRPQRRPAGRRMPTSPCAPVRSKAATCRPSKRWSRPWP